MAPVKALIADDERLAREYLRQLLETRTDMVVAGECRNGLETVNSIFSLQPDLVFLDIQMPDLNGFDVIKRSAEGNENACCSVYNNIRTVCAKGFWCKRCGLPAETFYGRTLQRSRHQLDLAQKNKLSETNAAIESLLKLYNEKRNLAAGSFPPHPCGGKQRIFFVNVEEIIWLGLPAIM